MKLNIVEPYSKPVIMYSFVWFINYAPINPIIALRIYLDTVGKDSIAKFNVTVAFAFYTRRHVSVTVSSYPILQLVHLSV